MNRFLTLLIGIIPLASMGQNSITIQPDGNSGNDAMIWAAPNFGNDDNNYGSWDQLVVNAWTNSSVADTVRTLLQFDISMIPEGSEITSALLSLYNNPTGASHNGQHQNLEGTNEWEINRITEAWDEDDVTWNNKPNYTSENQILMNASTGAYQDFEDFSVTEMVQDMIDFTDTSFGFYIKLQNETPFKALVFASSEHDIPELRPRLIIEYESPVGIDELENKAPRKLIRIVDMLGREAQYEKNVSLIFLYDDGSSEHRVILNN